LRFQQLGGDESNAALSDAFTAELITSLSRMRWLHVISRGSSFRFDPKNSDPQDIGIQLGVRYLITGAIEIVGASLTISIDIQSTEDGTLIWSDRFVTNISEFHQTREEIAASAIAILELTVPQFEANHSRSLDTTQLDAWSHFHMGLTHIYRFNQSDNRVAVKHFNEALKLDPQFARAHAGLSFTHWQNAFMQFRNDRSDLVNMAIDSASRALEIDPIDPFANFNMGRARWIEGDVDGSKIWLDRALQINPNYAQCHYNKGVILTLSGAVDESQSSTHKAMSLSPLDPLYYAMLSVRAMSHITKDEFDIASELSERAMQSPGAHFYIALIAASSHELNGDVTAGQKWLNHALRIRPDVTAAMFLSAFPFQHGEMRKKMTGALHRLGLK
jgi:TolB-like protein/Flp pilus assembly protein TadD